MYPTLSPIKLIRTDRYGNSIKRIPLLHIHLLQMDTAFYLSPFFISFPARLCWVGMLLTRCGGVLNRPTLRVGMPAHSRPIGLYLYKGAGQAFPQPIKQGLGHFHSLIPTTLFL